MMKKIIKQKEGFRCGFIAIAGAPNAGKSTLLNRILGEKLSITSRKPQTTRDKILAVVHREDSQLIFIDTPGVHKATDPMNVKMVDVALSAISDVDLVLLMVDISSPDTVSEDLLVEKLERLKKPVILALNKTDLKKNVFVTLEIEKWKRAFEFEKIIAVSAKHGAGVEELLDILESTVPEGPQLFPDDMLTDVSERFIVAEMIREKAFRLTGQEIPYSIAVTIDTFKTKKKLVAIEATIHVERDSQKGIIIGKGGAKLKAVGEAARADIERLMGTKVFLKLFVRVQKNWSKDTKAMRNFGY